MHHPWVSALLRWRVSRLISIFTVFACAVIVVRWTPSSSEILSTLSRPAEDRISQERPPLHEYKQTDQLQVIIPATKTNLRFCKVLYSSIINRYTPPVLINYKKTYTLPEQARAGKIVGLNQVLTHFLTHPPTRLTYAPHRTLNPGSNVLVIDGFDAWFQLPPHILLSRFSKISSKETQLVLGADKECWPNVHTSLACTAPPNSTPPPHPYGPPPDLDKWHYKTRPKFLNSGTIIGNLNALARMYTAAESLIEKTRSKGDRIYSDQLFLADLFGAQEDARANNRVMAETEFGMALDYHSQFFQTMTHSHDDVTFSSESVAKREEEDLTAAIPGNPSDRDYKKPVLTRNVISGVTPAVLHFNGPKQYMEMWWPEMWWFRHYNRSPKQLLHDILAEETSGSWFGSRKKVAGVWSFEENGRKTEWKWRGWEELCGEFEHELTDREEVRKAIVEAEKNPKGKDDN